jgi:CubicO group peptidase (beta-lactamase class C family)
MRLGLVLLPATLLFGARGAPATLTAQRSTAVDALVRAHMAEHQIPGAQVAVVQFGRITHLGAYGLASIPHAVPVRNATRFSIASATKSFSGVALMQLVEAGRLSLEAPVSQYVDGLPPAWRTITVRQLATHTSGLPDIVRPESGALIDPLPDSAWARVLRLPMLAAPGTTWNYNQTNYWLLGRVVERVTSEPLARVVARQFAAAGMTSTSFGDVRDVIPSMTEHYSYFRTVGDSTWRDTTLQRLLAEFPAPLRMAGGINSSARDIAQWCLALLGNRLLSATSRDTLWASPRLASGRVLGAGETNGYGIGWPTFTESGRFSAAGIGGGRAAFFLYPKEGVAVVVLTNLQGARPELLAQRIATRVLKGP